MPDDLHKEVKQKAKDMGFNSVTAYLNYLATEKNLTDEVKDLKRRVEALEKDRNNK